MSIWNTFTSWFKKKPKQNMNYNPYTQSPNPNKNPVSSSIKTTKPTQSIDPNKYNESLKREAQINESKKGVIKWGDDPDDYMAGGLLMPTKGLATKEIMAIMKRTGLSAADVIAKTTSKQIEKSAMNTAIDQFSKESVESSANDIIANIVKKDSKYLADKTYDAVRITPAGGYEFTANTGEKIILGADEVKTVVKKNSEDILKITNKFEKAGQKVLTNEIPDFAVDATKGIKKSKVKGLYNTPENIAFNEKQAKIANSIVGKAAAFSKKNPLIVAGVIMSTIYGAFKVANTVLISKSTAEWGHGEGLDTLGMAESKALQTAQITGDYTEYNRIRELIVESTDPETFKEATGWIPTKNVLNSLEIKRANVLELSNQNAALAEARQNEVSDEDKWAAIYEQQAQRDEEKRIADAEYYQTIEDNRKKAKDEERKADEEYWANIQMQNWLNDEQKRKDEQAYWDEIRAAQEAVNVPNYTRKARPITSRYPTYQEKSKLRFGI
jgi:hypothetical protein